MTCRCCSPARTARRPCCAARAPRRPARRSSITATSGIDLVPGSGLLAADGARARPPAWLTLFRDHGTATLRQVTEAAIHYASTGFPVLPQIAATIDARRRAVPHGVADVGRSVTSAHGRLAAQPGLGGDAAASGREAEAASADRDAQIEHALRSWQQGFVADEIDAFARDAVCGTRRVSGTPAC